MRAHILSVILAAATCGPALANDTTAELATGGLNFVTSSDIEMRSEDLAISLKEIRVRYEFYNNAARDITTLVAFPVPDVTVAGMDDNVAFPTENPDNLLDFHTLANGKPVDTKAQNQVTALGVDRTEMLRKLGIPLAPQLSSTNEALDKLPPERWDDLIRLGLAAVEEYDAGTGMRKHLAARWTLKTVYYWEQTFPAHAALTIEHRYKPSVGGSAETALGGDWDKSPEGKAEIAKYCVEPSLVAAVARFKKAAEKTQTGGYAEQRIEYVLKTGANWDGPIKDFRLTVDKGDPAMLLSFCGDAVKKISATQFEMRKTDFLPEHDLSFLFLVDPKRLNPDEPAAAPDAPKPAK